MLAPWEKRRVGAATIHAVPALHDVYEVGYVIPGADRCVCFAGDTRSHPDLPAIAERFSPDVAILPVDGTRVAGSALAVAVRRAGRPGAAGRALRPAAGR